MYKSQSLKLFCTVLLFSLIIIFVSGCSSAVKVSWVSKNSTAESKASYGYYNGVSNRDIKFREARSITLHYEVVVKEGSLRLQFLSPEKVALWEGSFTADEKGSVTFDKPVGGTYRLISEGTRTKGSYKLNWSSTY